MSTVKAFFMKHPSSPVNNIAMEADGTTRFAGAVTGGGLDLVATLPAFTAQASVSFNNVFSSAYTDYVLVFRNILTSVAQTNYMRLRAVGVDAATNYINRNIQSDPTISGGSSSTAYLAAFTWGTTAGGGVLTLLSPASANRTFATGQFIMPDAWGIATNSVHTDSIAYDGFSLIAASGTISGGPTKVYGYRNG